ISCRRPRDTRPSVPDTRRPPRRALQGAFSTSARPSTTTEATPGESTGASEKRRGPDTTAGPAGLLRRWRQGRLQLVLELPDLLLGTVPGQTVALLQLAGEVVAMAIDHVQVIVGELAPLALDAAGEPFPLRSV